MESNLINNKKVIIVSVAIVVTLVLLNPILIAQNGLADNPPPGLPGCKLHCPFPHHHFPDTSNASLVPFGGVPGPPP